MPSTKFRIYDGEKWHTPSIHKRLVVGPNGNWQLRRFPDGADDGNVNEVIRWDGGGEIIAWSGHDDHKLEINDSQP